MTTVIQNSILLLYLIFAIYGTFKVIKSPVLINRQKIYHIILMWLIPFLWYIVITIINKPTSEYSQKPDRSDSHFHESGKGVHGGTGLGGGM